MKKLVLTKCRSGFTIIELLVVIVIIGVLALLSLNLIGDSQERARIAQAQSEIAQLRQVTQIAKVDSSLLLSDITGTTCSDCPCRTAMNGSLVTIGSACWDGYSNALASIAAASGGLIDDLSDGDPWDNPYLIDENEAESTPGACIADTIKSAGPDLTYGTADDIVRELAFQDNCQ